MKLRLIATKTVISIIKLENVNAKMDFMVNIVINPVKQNLMQKYIYNIIIVKYLNIYIKLF